MAAITSSSSWRFCGHFKRCRSLFCKIVQCRIERSVTSSATIRNSSTNENNENNKRTRVLRVAIIGEPNCGKSTLVNGLVGNQVSIVTSVPHTTRQRTLGVCTEGESQLVLLDTPGVVTAEDGKRLKMTKEHLRTPASCLEEVDLAAVLTDSSNKYQRIRIHHEILNLLETKPELQTILILNKIDLIRHKVKLLHYSAVLTKDREKDKWGYLPQGGMNRFDQVFMVSALSGDGIQQLNDYLIAKAKPDDWPYSPGVTTDLNIQEQIAEVFRGKLLSLYKHEIPWQTKQVNVFCEENEDGSLKVHQKLFCLRESQRRCILEKFGELERSVKYEIENMLGCNVQLTIEVGVSKAMVNNLLPMI